MPSPVEPRARFPLGRTVATPGALQSVTHDEIMLALSRHECGDWGNLDAADKAVNETALKDGKRLVSVYTTLSGVRFYVITEWDRSITTVLLPREY